MLVVSCLLQPSSKSHPESQRYYNLKGVSADRATMSEKEPSGKKTNEWLLPSSFTSLCARNTMVKYLMYITFMSYISGNTPQYVVLP